MSIYQLAFGEFILVILFLLMVIAWRKLRLRRAIFMLRKQISWCFNHAPRTKLVLEVGSGHNPHIRSDILCEKYVIDNSHRSDNIVIDRPIVVGDAQQLPFRDNAFDVIIANHVIEHLDDPQRFFSEAGRVANSGLFTAPTALREMLISDPQHRWSIYQQENTLIFQAKSTPILYPEIQAFCSSAFYTTRRFDQLILDHWKELELWYEWEIEPTCKVIGRPGTSGFVVGSTREATVTCTLPNLERWRTKIRSVVRKTLHVALASKKKVQWSEILVCPVCHGELIFRHTNIICPKCELSFPYDKGIPVMLVEIATSLTNVAHS